MNKQQEVIVRQAQVADIDKILEIIAFAKSDFASRGIDQWQNGNPNKNDIVKDVADGVGWVIANDCQKGALQAPVICAYAMLSCETEPAYEVVHGGGQWGDLQEPDAKRGMPYATIHRVAVAQNARGCGYAKKIIAQCEQVTKKKGIPWLRIDTHQDNVAMQGVIKSCGFVFVGTVVLEDGSSRLAYQKRIA